MIRPIAVGDKAPWARLFVAYGIFYETAFTQEIVDAVFARLVDGSGDIQALVAESNTAKSNGAESGGPVSNDTIAGFAIFRTHFDTFTAAGGWHLDDLYVDPAHRGHGIATDLIEAVAIIARESGGGTLRWITAADNHAAQRVYDKVARRTTWVTYEKET